ncbi:hypothetical protein B0H14DRAFT_2571176 [Mycena olivaceomarginata]|nr:hypothetical protein B0H14DRAFT_2571176 [Mycena olivaceomarginata]
MVPQLNTVRELFTGYTEVLALLDDGQPELFLDFRRSIDVNRERRRMVTREARPKGLKLEEDELFQVLESSAGPSNLSLEPEYGFRQIIPFLVSGGLTGSSYGLDGPQYRWGPSANNTDIVCSPPASTSGTEERACIVDAICARTEEMRMYQCVPFLSSSPSPEVFAPCLRLHSTPPAPHTLRTPATPTPTRRVVLFSALQRPWSPLRPRMTWSGCVRSAWKAHSRRAYLTFRYALVVGALLLEERGHQRDDGGFMCGFPGVDPDGVDPDGVDPDNDDAACQLNYLLFEVSVPIPYILEKDLAPEKTRARENSSSYDEYIQDVDPSEAPVEFPCGDTVLFGGRTGQVPANCSGCAGKMHLNLVVGFEQFTGHRPGITIHFWQRQGAPRHVLCAPTDSQ